MARKSGQIDATVHITSEPEEIPVGILTRCLFGLSVGSLAQEISRNTDGKWDCIYAE